MPYKSNRNVALAASLLLATLTLNPTRVHAATPAPANSRSVWFWQLPDSPWGSESIVGKAAREDETITHLKSFGITMLYGSYSEHVTEAALRAWNRKLAANGIASYRLLSTTEDLFPENWSNTTASITANFLSFNKAATSNERYVGLAFDVEPHTVTDSGDHPDWKSASPIVRRQYMADYLKLYQNARALLDRSGESKAKLEATLPTWYSRLGDTIQWSNTLDRDEWFTQLSQLVDRLSIMAFEVPSPTGVIQRSQEELDLLHGKGHIALRANLGKEWKTGEQFWQAVQAIEATTDQPIEIQDYARLSALPTTTKNPQ